MTITTPRAACSNAAGSACCTEARPGADALNAAGRRPLPVSSKPPRASVVVHCVRSQHVTGSSSQHTLTRGSVCPLASSTTPRTDQASCTGERVDAGRVAPRSEACAVAGSESGAAGFAVDERRVPCSLPTTRVINPSAAMAAQSAVQVSQWPPAPRLAPTVAACFSPFPLSLAGVGPVRCMPGSRLISAGRARSGTPVNGLLTQDRPAVRLTIS